MKKLFYFVGIAILVISCQQAPEEGVQIKNTGKNNDVNLIFQSPVFEKNLSITGIPEKNKGSIYLETSEGKTWLRGSPDRTTRDSSGFQAVWELNDRKVLVTVQTHGQIFDIQFRANPDGDIL